MNFLVCRSAACDAGTRASLASPFFAGIFVAGALGPIGRVLAAIGLRGTGEAFASDARAYIDFVQSGLSLVANSLLVIVGMVAVLETDKVPSALPILIAIFAIVPPILFGVFARYTATIDPIRRYRSKGDRYSITDIVAMVANALVALLVMFVI